MITALILPVPTQRPALDLTQDVVGAGLLELHRAAVDASLTAGETPLTDAVVWLCRSALYDRGWRQRVGLSLVTAAQRVVLCLPSPFPQPPFTRPYVEVQDNGGLTEEQHNAAQTWTLVLRRPADQVLVRFIPPVTPRDGAARFVTEDDVRQGQRLNSIVRAVVRGELPTDALATQVGLDMGHVNSSGRVRELEARIASLEGRTQELQAQIPGTAQYKLRQLQRPPPNIVAAGTLAIDPQWASAIPQEHWAKTRAKTRRRK